MTYCRFFYQNGHFCKKGVISNQQKLECQLRDTDMSPKFLYKYISNILYPIWKYTRKGFTPTPPHPMPGPPQTGPGGGHGVRSTRIPVRNSWKSTKMIPKTLTSIFDPPKTSQNSKKNPIYEISTSPLRSHNLFCLWWFYDDNLVIKIIIFIIYL